MGETALQMTDKKADEILTGLAAGKTREQMAIELGYKNYKSLDIYMKRKNFDWDNKRNYYFPKRDKLPLVDALKLMNRPGGRAATVLSLLKSGLDLKETAAQLKFQDHREMALFMKSKGYTWVEQDQTYLFSGKDIHHKQAQQEERAIEPLCENRGVQSITMNESNLQVMTFLENNKEILFDLIASHTYDARLPRYIIPGVYTTKSVHMNYGVDQLIKEYSAEKNVSQKDIFEVALIDFFKKYGFHSEISTLIER